MATKEKLKTRAARAGEEMRSTGRLVLHAPALVRTTECVMRFLLGAVLSGAEIFGGYAPFGLAIVGASGSGLDGFSALLGACFGYLSFQGFTEGLRYVAAAILVFSVSFAFYDIRLYRKVWFMPLVTALLDAVTGFVYLSKKGWFTEDTIFFATELLLAASAVYFFRTAFSPWTQKREGTGLTMKQTVSLLILGGTVLITLSKITILGDTISLGRFAAALAVMVTGYQCGLGAGAAVGVTTGLAMDIAAGGAPFYSMAYGFAGLMTGVFRKQGKLFAALTYVLSNAIAVLWTWNDGLQIAILYEVFIASVLFLLLPERFFRWAGALTVTEPKRDTTSKARAYVKERLDATAEAFRALGESLRTTFTPAGPNDNDAAVVFDRAADRVCRKCALQSSCWQRDYVTTFNALNDALPAMMDRGRGEAADFPAHFSNRCLRFSAFLNAANEELTALLYRRQYKVRLQENRSAVCREYGALAEVLGAAAAEFGTELSPDPIREKRLKQHMTALGLEGDAAVFYDAAGRLRIEVEGPRLDGLKTGEELKKLSSLMNMPLRQVVKEEGRRADRLVFAQAEPLMAVAGVAARKKDGQTVSGDTGAWFKLDDGSLYVLLCDGMGSGPEASEDSTLAVRLLEQFLRAGVAPETALRTLNSALALRGEERAGFTTIDLLRVDLFTGEAAVYKYGAAPTYVRKGETVSRITGSALPAGLSAGEGGAPDVIALKLEAGDLVLLVSDGVTGGGDDIWLRQAMGAFRGDSPKDLACALIDAGDERDVGVDDRTALVLCIGSRNE